MNMRSLVVVMSSASALLLSACVFTSGPTGSGGTDGTGGEGASTGDGTGGNVDVGGVGGAGGAGGAGGGTATCDENYKCASAIDPTDGDPTKLCDDSESAALFDKYYACACTNECNAACGSTACAGTESSAACTTCRQDKCAAQLSECANDF